MDLEFTPHQQRVLKALEDNHTIQEMADALNMKIKNVKYHLSQIYKKTGTKNRFQLFKMFFGRPKEVPPPEIPDLPAGDVEC